MQVRRRASAWLLVAVPSWALSCGAPAASVEVAGRFGAEARAKVEAYAGRGQGPAGPAPTGEGQAPRQGSVLLLLTADRGGAGRDGAVISVGVPFPPGVLRDAALVAVRDPRGAPISTRAEALATWPVDGSIRSVLVAFRASLLPGEQALYRVEYGDPRSEGAAGAEAPPAPAQIPAGTKPAPAQVPANAKPAPAQVPAGAQAPSSKAPECVLPGAALGPNPDGPIAATLPPSWYAASEVSGPQVPASEDSRFPAFESAIERGLEQMSPPYESYGVACDGPHRTYYDGPHALYQRFLRNGDAARFRRARTEAAWYREHELRYSGDRKVAMHVCQAKGWTPGTPFGWNVLRRMLGQGMLDDYLLTGDPAAREAVIGMGEALRQDLPALNGIASGDLRSASKAPKEDVLLVSERNMAWAMMTLTSYYAVDPRPEVLSTLRDLVDRTIAWQARGRYGAFEHDVNRVDPDECERGPRGASPFMTALLVDALMDYYALTSDDRVRDVIARAAAWLEERALTSDRRAFRYLWGCETNPYDDSGVADLNLLIVPVFGAAYTLTGDARWLQIGDHLADIGVEEMQLTDPKHWNQMMRGFGRYLGYRARAIARPYGAARQSAP